MTERLQKYLARAGVASRRACEELILSGRVKVNGRIVRVLGTSVEPGVDVVDYDGRRIEIDPRRVYLLVYKPEKMISAAFDPEGRPVVTSLVPRDFGRVYPVGRLDWDSEGAVLMTNDGELTELLTHPRHEVEKTYMVKVTGVWGENDPRIEKVRGGVKLDDGFRTQPAKVFRDSDTGKHTWFVVSISEGHNRQIRRMFEAVHIDVRRLKRVAYGPVVLGDLEPGEFRRLTEEEIEELYRAAGRERPPETASRGRIPWTKREGQVEATRVAQKDTTAGKRVRRPPAARVDAPASGGSRQGAAPGARDRGGAPSPRGTGGGAKGAPRGGARGSGETPRGPARTGGRSTDGAAGPGRGESGSRGTGARGSSGPASTSRGGGRGDGGRAPASGPARPSSGARPGTSRPGSDGPPRRRGRS
jgi:23S rRNA pseudouridine2605 synthase